ncbi:MAG: hypothetical protein NXI31_14885 [bacterium]|nr:hypothetical protein [bacterium]
MNAALRICLLGSTLLATPAIAQIPDGWMIAGCYRITTTQPCSVPGFGGLFAFDPRGQAVHELTGVPNEIRGDVPASTFIHGTDFVLRVPNSDLVIANAWGDSTIGQQMPVFVLELDGLNVVARERYDVGIVGPGAWGAAGLAQADMLPDGKVLLAVDPLTFQSGETFASAVLAVLDPTVPAGNPGAITVVPVNPLPTGSPNAIVYDEARGAVWLGVADQTTSTVYRIDYPGGGTPVAAFTLPPQIITGLALQHDGKLLATGYEFPSGAARLTQLDPAGLTATPFSQVSNLLYAETVHVEPATGDIYLVAGAACSKRDVYRITPGDLATGVLQPAVGDPVGGWGVASGLDLDPNPEVFGEASGAASLTVNWQVAPNPTGLPRIGNTGFELELHASTAPLFAGAVLGLSNTAPPVVPGIQVLIDPLLSLLLATGTAMSVPLALPNDSNLVGLEVFAQGVFFDQALQLGATAGVHVTVMR